MRRWERKEKADERRDQGNREERRQPRATFRRPQVMVNVLHIFVGGISFLDIDMRLSLSFGLFVL